ncbi:uncharacterized protein N7500_010064 [Penicillium coprophilum]|uniref:uncharacterized protein n=1 Tax=Penicillium coprophilum TaxID=36646 RepID=UPI002396BC1F|nr:uncharacterized protein N7500_010064 [Penicillium coprophilum]KAJ5154625.1 hypothetical protein N7500_010064 [Penicillium coprophilum]
MAENVVHDIADQLECLTAQSPAGQDASHVSAVQVEVTEHAPEGSVLNTPENIDGRVSTPTLSDMTDIDESLLEELADLPHESHSVPPGTHFINPTAPRVSYHVSASGEVVITEDAQITVSAGPSPEPRPTPPPAFISFNRLAKGLSPKPKTTPTTPTKQPPSLAVERIIGPKQPIPSGILDLLEEWHENAADTEHPAALTGRAPSTWKNFRTFNDDGDESELSVFQISLKGPARRIVTYRIMILHAQNGPEELVVYGKPRPRFRGPSSKGIKGLYLLDWLETETKGEVQACGLKLWRTDDKAITFSPHMFDDGRKCTRLPGPNDIFNTHALNSTPKKHPDVGGDAEDTDSISSEPPFTPSRSMRKISTSTKAETEIENRTPVPSRLPWAKSISPVRSSENHDKSHSLGSPWRPSQKRRRSTLGSNDEISTPIRYKLMSDVSDQVRIFKTDDAKIVFQKAQEFYMGMDKRTGLLCTVSGLDGVRYVGEGCVDEFDILQEDIRKTSSPGGEVIVVEVKPAMGF